MKYIIAAAPQSRQIYLLVLRDLLLPVSFLITQLLLY